jgi:2-iminoacetate synthase
MYNSKSPDAAEFMAREEVLDVLNFARANKNNRAYLTGVLEKARRRKGLNAREASALLRAEGFEAEIFALAREIKEAVYGRRVVLFAPLYLSNYCVNGCAYCPYHCGNKNIRRKKLSQDEIRSEVLALQKMGHKRLALETGEDPVHCPIEYVLESIKTVYGAAAENGVIRRVNVNVAATTEENYKKLKDAGIGTYILFQETYDRAAYERLHPTGPKADYDYHTEAMDRAMRAGIDDVGIGALFGLSDPFFDFAALLLHAKHLEDVFGVGPHTVSVPRIRSADGVDLNEFPHAVSDGLFQKIVAVLRVAVPYTGLIVSTRESESSRAAVLQLGVSQISGGSRTSVGGYVERERPEENSAQFEIEDARALGEIVTWLMKESHVPSFCTACYRAGRTGDRFMRLAKTGRIGNVCQANALITLKEYLEDYAGAETKALGEGLLAGETEKIPNAAVKAKVSEYMKEMGEGKRDFRF